MQCDQTNDLGLLYRCTIPEWGSSVGCATPSKVSTVKALYTSLDIQPRGKGLQTVTGQFLKGNVPQQLLLSESLQQRAETTGNMAGAAARVPPLGLLVMRGMQGGKG